jgi:hypothetical protein
MRVHRGDEVLGVVEKCKKLVGFFGPLVRYAQCCRAVFNAFF